jgi:DNA-binding HxlR family transcriptional regulator
LPTFCIAQLSLNMTAILPVFGGPCRFQDFERSLAGISPNTLSARLKRLEEHGIVERRFYEQHPPRAEYVLTGKGRQLRPVLKALLEWGRQHTSTPAAARSGG